jgi:ADP-ribose pyrophosphatase YjhB (NUDIX family)
MRCQPAACPPISPEKVARRELREEVGGRAAVLRCVGQFYTSNGISNEEVYVYFATGVAWPDCSWSGNWEKPTASPPSCWRCSSSPSKKHCVWPAAERSSTAPARWRCPGASRC